MIRLPGIISLRIAASPSQDIVLTPYEGSVFPKFKQLFEVSLSPPLSFLALDPAEAPTALVLENRSSRAVTSLCYRWIAVDSSGKESAHRVTSDSYMVDVYRPVVEALGRRLITQSKVVDESMIDHIAAGGGFAGVGIGGSRRFYGDSAQLTFQIDFVLFEDGEIAGPDPEHYGLSLQCRKRGAEFVARQIRLARAENHDVAPVLAALVDIPHFGNLHHAQGDRMVQWTQYYARQSLHRIRNESLPGLESWLKHLENRPEIPNYYRHGQERR